MLQITMNLNFSQLVSFSIFEGLTSAEIEKVLGLIHYRLKRYTKDQVIFSQHQIAHSLGLIVEGKVKVAKFFPSGNNIIIARFQYPDSFGEGTLFSSQNLNPSTIIADTEASILFIDQPNLLKLFSAHQKIMSNYIGLLSSKLVMLNQKISLLSLGAIRKKLAFYFLDLAHSQQSFTLNLPYSKHYLAQYLCIPRPSLSREIARMQQDGLIKSKGRTIVLADIRSLEEILLK